MPRLPSDSRKAAQGYDSSSDASLLPPNRAALIRNFLTDRAGRLRGTIADTKVWRFPASIDGCFFYSGEDAEDDRLLVVSGGNMYIGTPETPLTVPPKWDFTFLGSGFETDAQVRAAMFGTEMIFVQEGGITPLRFNGTNLYQCGIDAPTVAPDVTKASPSLSATAVKRGTVNYRYRYYDEFSRESEASPSTEVAFATANTQSAYIRLFPNWNGVDPQVRGAYIEATTAGGSVYYKIATLTRASGVTTHEDNAADATVSAGTVSAGTGRYSVPNAASCIASHKGYLFLNDTTNGYNVQISRLNTPTQFSTVTEVAASDGARLRIPGAREGNPVRQIAPFGSLLAVWLKEGFAFLWGDSSQDWKPRSLHIRGTVAPGSALRVDNGLWFLLDSSVYNLDYEGAFINAPVSREIDDDLRRHTTAEREAAVAEFHENRYCLSVGDTLYLYDFKAQGWVQYRRGELSLALALATNSAGAGTDAAGGEAFAGGGEVGGGNGSNGSGGIGSTPNNPIGGGGGV